MFIAGAVLELATDSELSKSSFPLPDGLADANEADALEARAHAPLGAEPVVVAVCRTEGLVRAALHVTAKAKTPPRARKGPMMRRVGAKIQKRKGETGRKRYKVRERQNRMSDINSSANIFLQSNWGRGGGIS